MALARQVALAMVDGVEKINNNNNNYILGRGF
jgi:hypothetical protein